MAISGINNYLLNSYYNSSSSKKNTGSDMMSSIIRDSKILTNPAMQKIYKNKLAEASTVNKDAEERVGAAADALGQSASKLSVKGAFDDADGKYSADKAVDSVKSFVKDYNESVSSLVKSDNTTALRKGASMVTTTAAFRKSLSEIGVTIGEDNKLSVDEDKLRNAKESSVKAVFSGNYSYASKVADRAQGIKESAGSFVNGTYDQRGNLSTYSNQILTTLLSSDA